MLQFFHKDLTEQKYTDISLVANKKRSPGQAKENFSIRVHKLVLAAHSTNLRLMMQDLSEDDSCLVLSGVTASTLKLLVEALYTGKVTLTGKCQLKKFEAALTCLNSFGILLNLRPGVLNSEYDYTDLFDEETMEKLPETEEPKTPEETFEVTEEGLMEVDMDSLLEEEDLVVDLPSPTIPEKEIPSLPEIEIPSIPEKEVSSTSSSTPRKRGRPSKAEKAEIAEKKDLTEQVIDKLLADDSPPRTPDIPESLGINVPDQETTPSNSTPTTPSQPGPTRRRGRPSKKAKEAAESETKPEVSPEIKKEENTKNETKSEKGATGSGGGKKRTRHEIPELPVEDDSPKRRRRVVDKAMQKLRPKKPNFESMTNEKLNEKMEEGQRPFIEWLQNEGFLRKTTHCSVKDCQTKMELEDDKDDIDGCIWKCPASSNSKKSHCPAVSVRDGSIFGRVKKSATTGKSDSLSWIIQIILCWSDNTSLVQCQQLTGADVDKIFFWYDECRDYYGTL